jgi:hypothetical protein
VRVVEIPFTLREKPGRVRVRYGVNDDPRRWGYHLVGMPYDIERARGCPVVEATVHHPSEGYGAILGWVQVIRSTAPREDTVVMVDAAPQMAGAGIPWCSWGVHPTLFDAPSTSHDDLEWRADAFLAVTPDSVMTPVVEPLCGFSWGYDVRDGTPSPVPVVSAGYDQWAAMRPVLTAHCPGWDFRDGSP